MPTPNDACEEQLPVNPSAGSSIPSCPPEYQRISARRLLQRARLRDPDFDHRMPRAGIHDGPLDDDDSAEGVVAPVLDGDDLTVKTNPEGLECDNAVHDARSQSPESQIGAPRDGRNIPTMLPERSAGSPVQPTLASSGFLGTRLRPTYSSSYLRPGSKFTGSQRSDKQVYDVEVTIKNVDLKESFLCGFLRIEGLTKDHPTLTTYFESEIIGSKYTFTTKHESWGAMKATDMVHWKRFDAWRPMENEAQNPDFHFKNSTEREHIFMRWKEYFLVPDHRVREISGASFEGFYYICFNQVEGTISGIYFHAKSEKYQQLTLHHVPDKGCFGAFEFR